MSLLRLAQLKTKSKNDPENILKLIFVTRIVWIFSGEYNDLLSVTTIFLEPIVVKKVYLVNKFRSNMWRAITCYLTNISTTFESGTTPLFANILNV